VAVLIGRATNAREDVANGMEALGHWAEHVARIEPLAGGVANDVWSVRVHGHLAVGHLGARSDADPAWETEFLRHLDGEGLTVPVPIPTTDSRLFADGLVVMSGLSSGSEARDRIEARDLRHRRRTVGPPAEHAELPLPASHSDATGLCSVRRGENAATPSHKSP
jgi:hypothetical protein